MYNFKFFTLTDTDTIDTIKKQYKKLAFKFHPDITKGTGEDIKAINNEYELILKELSKMHNKIYYTNTDFINIIDSLIKLNMKNVEIEVCGFFIWISGETKQYSKQLGKEGLKLQWHNNKKAWYFKPNWYVNFSRKSIDMDSIRNMYGSEKVNNNHSSNTYNNSYNMNDSLLAMAH